MEASIAHSSGLGRQTRVGNRSRPRTVESAATKMPWGTAVFRCPHARPIRAVHAVADSTSSVSPASSDKPMSPGPVQQLAPSPPSGAQSPSAELDEREVTRRARISAANTGKQPWNKGRSHTPGACAAQLHDSELKQVQPAATSIHQIRCHAHVTRHATALERHNLAEKVAECVCGYHEPELLAATCRDNCKDPGTH
jgi:hypothetical protein